MLKPSRAESASTPNLTRTQSTPKPATTESSPKPKPAKNILLLSDFDITKRPRPYRMLTALLGHYNLYAIAKECSPIKGVETFSYPSAKSAKERSQEEQDLLISRCKNKDFLPLIFTPNRLPITQILESLPPMHAIIIEDITLLPFATAYKRAHPHTKLLIDLREYYPLEYENDPAWLESFGAFFYFLCQQYLPQVDFAFSVSEAIARRYHEEFGLPCEILYSLPPYHDLTPSPVGERIEIVYHGFLSPDRNSHTLLEIAHHLKPHFRINILGLSNQKGFLESLQSNAPKNMRFLPPVEMREIIPFTQRFDLGILTLTPNTFNNANAMPNKFFEYIQARLGVISTPLDSLKPLIAQGGFGTSSRDFTPASLVESINSLTPHDIESFKLHSHQNAKNFSLEQNQTKILSWLRELLA